jgi:hypothetical protein
MYTFCGPGISSICLMYYFPQFNISQFKGLPIFYVQNLIPTSFVSRFSVEGHFSACSNSHMVQAFIVQSHHLHSSKSFAQHAMWLTNPLLEMLYLSVILCIRQCFVVSICTIRGTDIPYVFSFFQHKQRQSHTARHAGTNTRNTR